LYFHP
jgi:hypothetical protein